VEGLLEREQAPDRIAEMKTQLVELRKQATRLDRHHVCKVRELLDCMGVAHVEAEGEADGLCVRLVQKGVAFACLSEDMDMFVYGCPRVLRYLSLLNRTVVLYTSDVLLDSMGVTFPEFQQLCVLCGTDYTKRAGGEVTLAVAVAALEEFKNGDSTGRVEDGFYEWLEERKTLVSNALDLYAVQYMFDLRNYEVPRGCPVMKEHVVVVDRARLEQLLEPEGFMFL
jgi:5'-3' exonuclease